MSAPAKTAIVIGAGPAGLSAADELVRAGRAVSVLEQDPIQVGGLARTVNFKGFRFDLGSHRFFSKNPDIQAWWSDRLGDDFLEIKRLTRILYRGKYFHYPLRLSNVLRQFGPFESARCLLSYLQSQIAPVKPEQSFEDWVRNRFGTRLFEIFFKTYTEKVWGIPCGRISVDWAAQRIRGLSMYQAVANSIGFNPKRNEIKTLTERFQYPRLGCGMMWEKTRDDLMRSGVQIKMGRSVVRIIRKGNTISAIESIDQNGEVESASADDYVFSMPLSDLVLAIDPPLSNSARQAAQRLTYRNMLIVFLVVNKPDIFPDHWIYIHDPSVFVGRIANPRNWSLDMIPENKMTGLALDYFSSEGDKLWSRSDDELLALARSELEKLGIVPAGLIIDGHVVRVPRAYPVLDADYKAQTAIIREELRLISNLHVAGRNGMHKYNNQDHSMLTGVMAARAVNGEPVDPWKVNIDAVYNEEEGGEDTSRLIPRPIDPDTIGT